MQSPPRPGIARRFLWGVRYLLRGFGMWGSSPRVMFLGAIPALIVGALYTVAIIALIINVESIATWLTPFADDWAIADGIRVIVAIALLAGAIVLAALSFVAVTLAVGDPFYERIWSVVEARIGDPPVDRDESFWRGLRRGVGDALRLLVVTASFGLLVIVIGFVPIVGAVLAPVVGAVAGGWFLTVELVGFAFDARGVSLRDRRRMLGTSRATTLGFGLAVYLLFLIPLAAVFVMPAAVAGATTLARDALDAASHESDVQSLLQ